jgi:thiol-disulfide isomerase/thioredoxin
MKSINTLLLVLGILGFYGCLNGQNIEKSASISGVQSEQIEVFYFHYTRRCATCNAVESVAKKVVSEYDGDVQFTGVNLDEEAGEAIGSKMEVAGQTLLIVSGDKRINLTNEGFLHALSDPEKLMLLLHEKIDGLL